MSQLGTNWFTEQCPGLGSAFSLKIKQQVHKEQTPYALLEIFETVDFGYLMVIDGSMMLTTRDNFLYHEMMSHPVLFMHPNPKNVVIIGGGDCGTLHEALKHKSVNSLIQIEIDRRVTELAEIYFPELCNSNQDNRAQFYYVDGIEWIANTAAESIDVLIVDCTDPIGPAKGLFTETFYRNCVRALRKDGLFIQQGESPIYHSAWIKEVHLTMRKAGFSHTHMLNYPHPCYPSGWWCGALASISHDFSHFREQDVDNKTFATRYYNSAIHKACLALPNFIREEVFK
jgi:spermidine synthase